MADRIQRKILIVDDSPEDRETYRRYLLSSREYEYLFLEAESGEEGLALWQAHQPDAVLLDYRLPDLDGLEFLAALQPQALQPLFPILMMTGQGNETIAVQAIKAGAQEYLVKGYLTPERLQTAVDRTIQTVQLKKQLQHRVERERVVAQIIQKVARSLDLDEVLSTITEEVRQFLQTDRVVVFRLDSQESGTVVAESVGAQWQAVLSNQFYDPCFAISYVERQRQGQVTVKPDIYDGSIEPCHVELLERLQVRSNLVVPIQHEGGFWGVLIAHHCAAPRQWQPLEIELLQQLTEQTSIAIRQAELYQQAQHELAERKRQEAALRQSEAMKHLVLEGSSDCIKVLDLNARLLYMNAGGLCLLEIEDLSPYVNAEWLCFWQGDDQELAEAAIAAALSGEVGRFQGFCPTVKGKPKWWDVIVTPIRDINGEIVQFLSISRDISDIKQIEQRLRESEERLQLGIQVAGVAIAKVDYQTNTVQLSPEAAALYGFSQDELTVTRDRIHATFYPDDQALLAEHIQQGLDPNGEGWFALDHRIVLPTGEVRWLSVRKQVFFTQIGKPRSLDYAILAAVDVTDRKQAELELERALQIEQVALAESERANRSKDEFLAVLSHELRSPLNPILGWTKMLQTRRLDESRTREALATIERNAKAQGQLIDDLLDMARVLRGKLVLNSTPVNLRSATEAAIDTVRTAVTSKSLQMNLDLSDVGQVWGDAVRLQQIIWNLLSNAVKFTPNGGRIDVCLEAIDHQAQITIADTGKGISPDFLPHIFESFRQEDTSVTRQHGGLGLGMAIVYQLVQAHGGTVTADSAGERKGAKFQVRLPLLNFIGGEIQGVPLREQNLDLTGIRVLAIDDEPDNRDILSIIVEQAGANIRVVASADEFLAALAAFQPDVLISDIGMPEVDGYTLLKRVRSLPPEQGGQIPAIAVTAYAGERDQQRSQAAGFQEHVAKPVEPEQLVATIRYVVNVASDQLSKLNQRTQESIDHQ